MYSKIKQILHNDSSKNILNSVSIFLISEGFTLEMENLFWNYCKEFLTRSRNYIPFNLLSYFRNSNLLIYCCFVPSENKGPSLSFNKNSNKTVFGSYLDIENKQISLNVEEIKNKLGELSIRNNGLEINLFDLFFRRENQGEKNVPIFLVPVVEEFPYGADNDYIYKEIEYVATTLSGYWEQIIFKLIGRLAGLADEYEFEGESYLKMEPELNWNLINLNPNLLSSFEVYGKIKNAELIWRNLMYNNQKNNNINVNKSTLHPNAPDYELPKYNYSPDKIEIFEGGGGYRTNIFRSSHDCLMRRKFGSISLPIRKEKISFCKICEAVLLEKLQLSGNFRMNQLRSSGTKKYEHG